MHSVFIAYLLWFIGGLGCLGLHRHYLGKHPTGFLWMFTGGMGFLGSVYDFFTLGQQVRDANLKNALYDAGMQQLQHGVITTEPRQASKKPSLEQSILRAAQTHGGLVTPSQVAVEGLYNLDECKKELERMASKGFCEMRVTSAGAVVFRFADFSQDARASLEI